MVVHFTPFSEISCRKKKYKTGTMKAPVDYEIPTWKYNVSSARFVMSCFHYPKHKRWLYLIQKIRLRDGKLAMEFEKYVDDDNNQEIVRNMRKLSTFTTDVSSNLGDYLISDDDATKLRKMMTSVSYSRSKSGNFRVTSVSQK